jgi:hypothetical protein
MEYANIFSHKRFGRWLSAKETPQKIHSISSNKNLVMLLFHIQSQPAASFFEDILAIRITNF